MATIICVDGLAGDPVTTFGVLKKRLQADGHNVVILETSAVYQHEDRVHLALDAYESHRGDEVFLVGQSAGGSAVRIAAERLEKEEKHLAGVILLSPAMPRGIFFMTVPLLWVVLARFKALVVGEMVQPTEKEFYSLVAPLPEDVREDVIASRQPVSGVEARTLAVWPPKFVGYKFPTLHIWGDQDMWVSSSAQHKLSKKLLKAGYASANPIPGVGHLTLASDKQEEVMGLIERFIDDNTP